ncbi:polysaccharide biosynthesis tyrosine autokinase [Thioclava sp. GXIMD4215]|uniref:polysaccharide biosynthesis tyrosine autokinase n=1 Tax=Thioclava sp. GXIMD4215 TaxID=3131928 RepID=UPI00311AD1D9
MSIQSGFRTSQPHLSLSGAPDQIAVTDGQVATTLKTLWSGRWLVASTTVLALGLGQLWLSEFATPLYRATTSVLLEPQDESLTDPDRVPDRARPIDDTIRRTEVEILRGRALLGTVVDDLALTADPEFNASLRAPGFGARLRALFPGQASTRPTPDQQREAAISVLSENVTIRNLAPSLVFELSAVTETPQKSALIADRLAQNYISQQIALKRHESDNAIRWLGQRLTDLQHQIETSNAELSRLSGSAATETARTVVQTRRLQKLEDDLATARLALSESQRRLQALPATAAPDARATREAQVAIDAATLRNLERQYGEIDTGLRSETETATRQKLLEQQSETDLLVYGHFLTRLKDTIAREGRQMADSRVLSAAVEPGAPYLPRPPLVLSLSAMLGAALGLMILLLRQTFRQTIRSAHELEEFTGQKVIGQLPRLPGGKGRSSIDFLHDYPDSPAAEALRGLRTNIVLEQLLLGQKVIAITSANPQEGKTTVSLGLARQMASLGKRVLVIEGDLRRRVFKEYLGVAAAQDMIGALTGSLSLAEAVHTDPRSGMDVLFGAKTHGNPADIFASEAFSRLLAEARDSYDYVIIDTPPVLCVPDTRIILQGCDRALFLVNWNITTRVQVRDGLAALHSSGRKLGGLILNRIDPRSTKEFYYTAYYSTETGRPSQRPL